MAYEKLFLRAAIAGTALLVLAIDSHAQSPPQDHSCNLDLAFEYTAPFGRDGNNFNSGKGFQAGGGFEVSRPPEPDRGVSVYITGNFMYDRLPATAFALMDAIKGDAALTGSSAHGSFDATTLDPTVRYLFNRRTSVYLVGGFGWLRRGVEFKGANPASLTMSNGLTLDRVATDSGVLDFGGGVNFGLTPNGGMMLFAEARVYRGLAVNTGTTLVPVSGGLRW